MYDYDLMKKLGKERRKLLARLDEIVPELEAEIFKAAQAGEEQVKIIQNSGYTRNTVRLASMTPQEREAERVKRRKAE